MLEYPNERKLARPTTYIPVHGTWGLDDGELAWWKPKSEFAKYATQFNMYQVSGHPFIWTSDLTGVTYNLLSRHQKNADWYAGGWALIYYCGTLAIHNRNIIAHSHGLQVVLYACANGLMINNLISVCSPIRADLNEITQIARPRISRWKHIYDSSDRIQWWGQFGDGRLFGSRESLYADENERVRGISHSDILHDKDRMQYWNRHGWFDYLRQ